MASKNFLICHQELIRHDVKDLYRSAYKGKIMNNWLEEPLTYTASMPELMTAQDIMYLAEDIVADNNILAIYKPAELSLEVV
jgi:hypothetical protein